MRIILSRKGFDSGSGGVANPILPDGRLAVLPIPSGGETLRYRDISVAGQPMAPIVESLTNNRVRGLHPCHLDPDLDAGACERSHPFQPAFGQTGAAARHLMNQDVTKGDLFLFFGWFRETVEKNGALRFKSGAPDLHVIYGWMQADRILRGEKLAAAIAESPSLAAHPHALARRLENPLNTIIVPTRALALPGVKTALPGYGLFSQCQTPLVLTAPQLSRVWWRLPDFMAPDAGSRLSYHEDASRWTRDSEGLLLRSAARGQEFVLSPGNEGDALSWLERIFECAPERSSKSAYASMTPEA